MDNYYFILCFNCVIVFFRPYNCQIGDLLVLTKPLGTQLATNAFIWMSEQNEKYQKLSKHFSDEEITNTYQMALKSMIFLNKNGNSFIVSLQIYNFMLWKCKFKQ